MMDGAGVARWGFLQSAYRTKVIGLELNLMAPSVQGKN